jgi:hypothetical protein
MIELREPYERRPIRFLEEWRCEGWRLKVYGIAYRREGPRAELIEAAKRLAREKLPRPADGEGRYGVGFLGVHDGRGADFVFVSWWADENELHHHVWAGPSGEPQGLKYMDETGPVACVWDLRVVGFERDAWVAEVLANRAGPDVEGYMKRRLNEDA